MEMPSLNQTKLQELAAAEGFEEVDDMLEEAVVDSVVPGICMRRDCDYSCEVEPDQTAGHCEECGTQTVRSCLILASLI